jgi:putative alpha-1,2-mannosidase
MRRSAPSCSALFRSALPRFLLAEVLAAGLLVVAVAPAAQAVPTPSPAGLFHLRRLPRRRIRWLRACVRLPRPAAAGSPRALSIRPSRSDPLIGTSNAGNVFPGAVLPFGMFSFSPRRAAGTRTGPPRPVGTCTARRRSVGFSLTHMSGTGCAGGSGDIPIFPLAGEVTSSPQSDAKDETYASTFSHTNEVAKPGYYKVGLDSGVTAELPRRRGPGRRRSLFRPTRPRR